MGTVAAVRAEAATEGVEGVEAERVHPKHKKLTQNHTWGNKRATSVCRLPLILRPSAR